MRNFIIWMHNWLYSSYSHLITYINIKNKIIKVIIRHCIPKSKSVCKWLKMGILFGVDTLTHSSCNIPLFVIFHFTIAIILPTWYVVLIVSGLFVHWFSCKSPFSGVRVSGSRIIFLIQNRHLSTIHYLGYLGTSSN